MRLSTNVSCLAAGRTQEHTLSPNNPLRNNLKKPIYILQGKYMEALYMSIIDVKNGLQAQKAIFQNIKKLSENSPKKAAVLVSQTQQPKTKVLGITMMADSRSNMAYGLRAQYATTATEEEPIIEIVSNYGGERTTYEVQVKQVNPRNATMLEMFALCSYADEKMLTEGSAFGSFRELKNYVSIAGNQKLGHKTQTYEEFLYEKHNWEATVNYMKEEFLEAGIYYQYQSCLQLLDIFEYFEIQEENDNYIMTNKEENKLDIKEKNSEKDKNANQVSEMMRQAVRQNQEKYD